MLRRAAVRRNELRQLWRQRNRQSSTQPPQSNKPASPPAPSPNRSTTGTNHSQRLTRLHARLPRFLQRFTSPLLRAPLSHITAFLLLHEITAVVPLVGLAGAFHYTNWLPPYFSEGQWISSGVEKFGRWFRRRGWLGEEAMLEARGEVEQSQGARSKGKRERWWGRGEGGVRILVEVATAYAITKALMPLRLIVSVWGTPWFARVAVIPSMNAVKGIFRR